MYLDCFRQKQTMMTLWLLTLSRMNTALMTSYHKKKRKLCLRNEKWKENDNSVNDVMDETAGFNAKLFMNMFLAKAID